jgi:hypothetical protein
MSVCTIIFIYLSADLSLCPPNIAVKSQRIIIKKTFHKSFIKNCPSGGVCFYTFLYVKNIRDGTFEYESGEVIALFSEDGSLHSCAVSLDGRTIVAGERSGRVQFLRLIGA